MVGLVGVSKYNNFASFIYFLFEFAHNYLFHREVTSILSGGKNSLKITLVPP